MQDGQKCRHGNCGTGKCGTILQGWKMQDWKIHDRYARVENAGSETSLVHCCLSWMTLKGHSVEFRFNIYKYVIK